MPIERETIWEAFQILTAAAQNLEHQNTHDYINDVLHALIDEAAKRVVIVKVIADATALTTGDNKAKFVVPAELNGFNLVAVGAHVYTASTSGTPTIQIHNATQAADMLTTRIILDVNEKDSSTSATPAVIDAANDDVATGDEIRIDVDVAGTDTAGLEVRMTFQEP